MIVLLRLCALFFLGGVKSLVRKSAEIVYSDWSSFQDELYAHVGDKDVVNILLDERVGPRFTAGLDSFYGGAQQRGSSGWREGVAGIQKQLRGIPILLRWPMLTWACQFGHMKGYTIAWKTMEDYRVLLTFTR